MAEQVGLLKWTVTVKMDSTEGVYEVEALRYYDAKVKGLTKFLDENNIPGRPYEYLSTKSGLVEIHVQCHIDRRLATEPYPVGD